MDSVLISSSTTGGVRLPREQARVLKWVLERTKGLVKALHPVLFFGQFRHACANLIPDLTDNLDGQTLSVGQRPIQLIESRNVREAMGACSGGAESVAQKAIASLLACWCSWGLRSSN